MVDVATSVDFETTAAVDSSMFDIADASSCSFSSESWDSMDFIPFGGSFDALVEFLVEPFDSELDWCSP